MKGFLRVLCATSLGLLLAASAFAQISTAQLAGKVTDNSGAVLPGVTVTMTQAETGAARSVVTDAEGAYLVSNLPPGPYRLEVALSGFKTYVQTGIVMQVAATPTINVALDLGGLEETVTVEAAAPLVDVKSAGVSEVVESERIVETDLNGTVFRVSNVPGPMTQAEGLGFSTDRSTMWVVGEPNEMRRFTVF